MNHNKLLKAQKKLDKIIKEAHNINPGKIKNKKNLALLVEFAEFANELQDFKYWKKNKNVNIDNVYEEFSDILHFFYSFFLEFGISDINSIEYKKVDDGIKASKMFYYHASQIWTSKDSNNDNKLKKSFSLLMGIASYYQLDEKQIELAYLRKNKINFDRVEKNY